MFEVNSSSKRSGKHILSQLEEATQSHLVINNKGPTPQSSFAGLFNKPMDNSSPATGPLGAFLNTNANASDAKTNKGVKGKKKQKMKETKKDVSKGKGRSILKQPPQAVNDDTESCSSLSSKAASLILFEEVGTNYLITKSEVVMGKSQTKASPYRLSDGEVNTVGRGLKFSHNDQTVEVIKLFIIWHKNKIKQKS